MPIPVKRAGEKALRLSLSVLVGVMPVVLGCFFPLLKKAEQASRGRSSRTGRNAVQQFERMLEQRCAGGAQGHAGGRGAPVQAELAQHAGK